MWAPAAPPALPPPGRQTAGSSGWSHAAGQAPFPAGRAPFSQQPPRGGGSLPSPWQLQRRSSRLVAGAGVRDRGEWTRFLEWNDSGDGVSAGTRASVECVLLDAESAAEVTVTAPDRPGLLSDISRAIASTGFNIDKVRPLAGRQNTRRREIPLGSSHLVTRLLHAAPVRHSHAARPRPSIGQGDDPQRGGEEHVPGDLRGRGGTQRGAPAGPPQSGRHLRQQKLLHTQVRGCQQQGAHAVGGVHTWRALCPFSDAGGTCFALCVDVGRECGGDDL